MSKNVLEKLRHFVAAGLDDLVVIFKSIILIASEGGLISLTNFIMFPMGILLQKTSALVSTEGSFSWLPFPDYRSSSLFLGKVRP